MSAYSLYVQTNHFLPQWPRNWRNSGSYKEEYGKNAEGIKLSSCEMCGALAFTDQMCGSSPSAQTPLQSTQDADSPA